MGMFDWFRKPKPAVPLPQLCYDVAYFDVNVRIRSLSAPTVFYVQNGRRDSAFAFQAPNLDSIGRWDQQLASRLRALDRL